jgi:hypothetical protein
MDDNNNNSPIATLEHILDDLEQFKVDTISRFQRIELSMSNLKTEYKEELSGLKHSLAENTHMTIQCKDDLQPIKANMNQALEILEFLKASKTFTSIVGKGALWILNISAALILIHNVLKGTSLW